MILILILYPLLSFAEILDENISQNSVHSVTKETFHENNSVCEKLQKGKFISRISRMSLKCENGIVHVKDYCIVVQGSDPLFIRGDAHTPEGKVRCRSAKKVDFKYECRTVSNKSICAGKTAHEACEAVQKEYAINLDLIYSTFAKSKSGWKELECKFDKHPLEEVNPNGL